MKLEWGIEVEPDYYDGPKYIAQMVSEEAADAACQEGQCVVFRYVGEWTKA